jgi:hypothetical protein
MPVEPAMTHLPRNIALETAAAAAGTGANRTRADPRASRILATMYVARNLIGTNSGRGLVQRSSIAGSASSPNINSVLGSTTGGVPAVGTTSTVVTAAINAVGIDCIVVDEGGRAKAKIATGSNAGSIVDLGKFKNKCNIGNKLVCTIENGTVTDCDNPEQIAAIQEAQRLEEIQKIILSEDWNNVTIQTVSAAEKHTTALGSDLRYALRKCLERATSVTVSRSGQGLFQFRAEIGADVVNNHGHPKAGESVSNWCIIGRANVRHNQVASADIWHHGPAA